MADRDPDLGVRDRALARRPGAAAACDPGDRGELPSGSGGPFVVGTIAAAVVGYAAIGALLGYVRRHTYTVFVVYRLALAATILLVILAGWRSRNF